MKNFFIPLALLLALISVNVVALEEYINVPALNTVWVERPNQVNDYRLISHISSTYGVQLQKAEEIVKTATKLGESTFPTKIDILAIIAIESNFNQFARAKGSSAKGLMQILYKPTSFEVEKNLTDGANLLKDYRSRLDIDAAVQAYNVGIGAYLKGTRNKDYLNKFKQAKKQLEKNIV